MKKIILTVLIVVVSAGIVINLPKRKTSFPETLGGMKLTSQETGEDAIAAIKKLHGYSTRVDMKEAAILSYRDVGSGYAWIWISWTKTPQQASDLLDEMNTKIDPRDGFTLPVEIDIGPNTPSVYHVTGYSSHHYYYFRGNTVYWLTLNGLSEEEHYSFILEMVEKFN